jgi:hypothetical protein
MPGQKNAGNKGRKRESGVAVRHRSLITALMDDLRANRELNDVFIGRVTKKLGNGRVDVFYVAMENEKTFDKEGNEIEKEVPKSYEKQAVIKGSFRGRGKHSVWVEVGGIVVVSDTGVGILEIVGVLTQEQLAAIAKTSFIDDRILKINATSGNAVDDAIEFGEEDEKDLSDGDIANI